MLFVPYMCFHSNRYPNLTKTISEWPPIGKKLLTRLAICFLSISI